VTKFRRLYLQMCIWNYKVRTGSSCCIPDQFISIQ